MAKSFKYKNDMYLDSTGIVHNKQQLNLLLNKLYDYSTSEINTGRKWIDGKDIYCKTVNIPLFSKTEIDVNTGIINIDSIINFEGCFKRDGFSLSYSIDNTYMAEWYIDTTTGILKIATNNIYVSFLGYITIYYTKN